MTALVEVDPVQAKGKISTLWLNLAQLYDSTGSLANANKVFWKAIQVEFKNPEELSSIYVGWAEMMIRNGNCQSALLILRHASGVKWLNHSLKLWNLYVDLEENIGVGENVKAIYNKMIEMKIITPIGILNYANWLQSNSYYEESFWIYE